ncbi:MAG: dethiobiotin synthetase [Cyclobacteriaceae bacterium]|jgi:dethiobiotin synthetase
MDGLDSPFVNYFITAIGTDSGKTLVSAIVAEMLGADYWKPVQSGNPRDTETVQSLVSNGKTRFYKERYLLKTPASPHASAKIDNVHIDINNFAPPISNRDLVIEGAGGLLVPLNDHDTILDLIKVLDVKVILVSNLYLGSINHTLLSVALLKQHHVSVAGIIFNGEPNPESEEIILAKSGYKKLISLLPEPEINKTVVLKYAHQLKKNWL